MARPCRLTAEQQVRLRAKAISGARDTNDLLQWAERELGVKYALGPMYKLLHRLGLTLRRNGYWQDPQRT